MVDSEAPYDNEPADDLIEELIRYLAEQLVDDPDAVDVQVVEEDRAIVYELTVAPTDLGKVIGRDGRTARAIRAVLAATSSRSNRRAILEILE